MRRLAPHGLITWMPLWMTRSATLWVIYSTFYCATSRQETITLSSLYMYHHCQEEEEEPPPSSPAHSTWSQRRREQQQRQEEAQQIARGDGTLSASLLPTAAESTAAARPAAGMVVRSSYLDGRYAMAAG